MTAYVDKDGRFIGVFDRADPPRGAVSVATAPADARQTWDGERWSAVPPRPYREERRDAYAQQLGKDAGNVINTLGDVLDTVIAELVARGAAVTPAFAEMLAKIGAIKAAHPKD